MVVVVVRTDVPSLGEEYAEREEQEQHAGARPAVDCEGRRLVQVGLEQLRRISLDAERCGGRGLRQRTRPYFVVCAVTAAKGVSGSGESMAARGGSWLGVPREERCAGDRQAAGRATGSEAR